MVEMNWDFVAILKSKSGTNRRLWDRSVRTVQCHTAQWPKLLNGTTLHLNSIDQRHF